MRKTLLLCLPFLLLGSLRAQFVAQNSGTQASLEDVRFYNHSLGIVVGDSGTIVRTTDGGDNWTKLPSVGGSTLSRVRFFDAQNAIIIGNNPSIILQSADGGQNWTTIVDSSSYYYDIVILNDSVALSSTPEALLRTQDRGQNWQLHYDGASLELLGLMSFINEQTGFSIVGWGGFGPPAGIQRTDDGGITWTDIPMLTGQNPTVLEALVYLNDSVGFAAGWYNPHLVKTTNAGTDWAFCATDDLQNGGQIIDLIMVNDTLGFACGWYGNIFKSVNAGANWYMLAQPMVETIQFKGLHFLDDQIGWVVGTQGTILKTSLGGGAVSLESEITQPQFSIYPNPTRGVFEIELAPQLALRSLAIYDMQARLVERFSRLPERLEIKEAGMYLIVIESSQGITTQKLWVQ